ncbi:MAG: Holliday junction branch migration protein RuvA [Pseudohongiellaceae bacterium]
MIGRIKGILLEKQAQEVLLDVAGVAYEVQVPMTTVFLLPEPGTEITLHTHFVVREDAQLLYGFAELRERSLFRILIRVNGVGPKLALTILSGIQADEFVNCVHGNDVNALIRLPGVGRKTAERLIIEVRDKLKEWELEGRASGTPSPDGKPGQSHSVAEAEAALVSLGYKPQEAGRAVLNASRKLEEEGREAGSEALIRLALKNMGL